MFNRTTRKARRNIARMNERDPGAGDRAVTPGAEAERQAFRARLQARNASRPQSTFAIDSGIVYRPAHDMPDQAHLAAMAARDAIERRRAGSLGAAAWGVPAGMAPPSARRAPETDAEAEDPVLMAAAAEADVLDPDDDLDFESEAEGTAAEDAELSDEDSLLAMFQEVASRTTETDEAGDELEEDAFDEDELGLADAGFEALDEAVDDEAAADGDLAEDESDEVELADEDLTDEDMAEDDLTEEDLAEAELADAEEVEFDGDEPESWDEDEDELAAEADGSEESGDLEFAADDAESDADEADEEAAVEAAALEAGASDADEADADTTESEADAFGAADAWTDEDLMPDAVEADEAETPRAAGAIAGALPMAISERRGWNPFGGSRDEDDEEEDDELGPVGVATRIGDMSQIAFAGLAVLGLAGLSVMAAESALNGPNRLNRTTTADNGAPQPSPKPGDVSVMAIAAAAPEEPGPKAWFNYQGMADMLAARKAEMDTQLAAEKAAADEAAKVQAANAIAEAEAKRIADEQAAAAAAAEQERLASEAEAKRVADAEAARVAAEEAQKAADAEAARKAAEEAEKLRLAEIEAKKKAEADAEAKRLADLETKRLADLEAQRKAAEEAARKEAFEQAKAEEAERLRVAVAKAEADRAAAEKAAAAKAEADRLAAQQAAAQKAEAERLAAAAAAPATPRRAPQPVVFVAYTGPVPAPASYKPSKPAVTLTPVSSDTGTGLVSRAFAPALTTSRATVRSFDGLVQSSPQTPQDFLVSRVQRNAGGELGEVDLQPVEADFTSLLTYGQDNVSHSLATPSGPELSIVFERTYTRDVMTSSTRTISFTPGADEVTRFVSEPAPVKVSVMCRDVAYAFANTERGRFAACETPDGDSWTLGRASSEATDQFAAASSSAS